MIADGIVFLCTFVAKFKIIFIAESNTEQQYTREVRQIYQDLLYMILQVMAGLPYVTKKTLKTLQSQTAKRYLSGTKYNGSGKYSDYYETSFMDNRLRNATIASKGNSVH